MNTQALLDALDDALAAMRAVPHPTPHLCFARGRLIWHRDALQRSLDAARAGLSVVRAEDAA